MRKASVLAYGLLSYAICQISHLYAVGFLGDFVVPKSIDSGPSGPVFEALLIDTGILIIFTLHHSLTARHTFKKWLTKFIPEPIERSTYILFVGLIAFFLYMNWRPIPVVMWNVENVLGRWVIYGFFFFGWLLIVLSSFAIDHFDFFGVRQVYLYWKSEPYTPVPFKVVSFYKYTRHPMMLGTVIVLWFTPTMTVGHMIFSAGLTIYTIIGIHFEERDLVNYFGEPYVQYQKNTPMIVPFIKSKH